MRPIYCSGFKKMVMKPFVVRPWSFSPCPTADELREAWANRKKSQKDFVWLLSVLGELTCYTDRTLVNLGGFGKIAGRNGGLKEFIAKNAPELLPKYKSISRYSRLAYRIKRAFNIYPPAALSLMHPDLPLPKRNMPLLTNHARKVFREQFARKKPTYAAYNARVRVYEKFPTKFPWGPPLPESEWAEAENTWRRLAIRPVALAQIRSDHSFYARDYLSPEFFMKEGERRRNPYSK